MKEPIVHHVPEPLDRYLAPHRWIPAGFRMSRCNRCGIFRCSCGDRVEYSKPDGTTLAVEPDVPYCIPRPTARREVQ